MRVWLPWSVVWADFSPQVGHEQAGRRPAVVVGSALASRISTRSGLVLVVPCSTTDRDLPWHPRLALGGKPGVALCDQLKSISVRRIVAPYHGAALSEEEIDQVRQVLRSLLA